MAACIAAQGDARGIPHATACRALGVSPAWFYKWRHGDPSPRHARRVRLGIEVGRLFAAHKGRYGAPRITADLRAAGERVSENTVAALMREQGLAARPKRRRKSTTQDLAHPANTLEQADPLPEPDGSARAFVAVPSPRPSLARSFHRSAA